MGYQLITDNGSFSSGGGVALYVKRDHTFKVRDDFKLPDIENIWIESADLVIAVIYKPPQFPNQDFLDKFEEIPHKIYLSKRRCLIMGDININTLSRSKISKDYLNLIRSEGFNPHIFEATHITEGTQTCIDHIHSNFALVCTSGSIAVEIADHLPVFSIVYDPAISPFPDRIEYRNFKKFNNM